MTFSTIRRAPSDLALIAGILLLAVNLRAPFTGLAPVLALIQRDFSLSTVAVGALSSLPLLAFAAFSPISSAIARKVGLERTIVGALALVALGIALRSSGTAWLLYFGTAVIGVGIAFGNVLLPSLIKRDFAGSVASLTGAYALTMGASGALGSTLVTPLAQAYGWQTALATFILLPGIALAVWAPRRHAHRNEAVARSARPAQPTNVWRSSLAWQVTLFMGFNAMIFYIAVSWLPTILIDQGLPPAEAGSMHGVLQLATAIPGLILAPVIRRMPDQRPAAVSVSLISAASLLGLIYLPGLAVVWAALLGFGSGASMILGLTFVGLRTRSAEGAGALSGMAQCIGYLMAAAGPMVVGAIHDWQRSWSVALLMAAGVALLGAWAGLLAGRKVHVEA
ncbi:TPA: MFS transporter [Burkholderia cenocepacia]|uniref:MFS transporter n=1 Tax=unclassified Burkholderia TaxID=2613784 RepID=UPI00158891BD|nr:MULTISPECIES: MFS transporter [unclassified Burkholderia]HEF5874956.1 MFS transporter [Burkholderia cenocepacia]